MYKSTYRRITWTLILLVVSGCFVLYNIIDLKVFQAEKYRKLVTKTTQSRVVIEGVRGDILATDGRKLACSIPNYRIVMDPCADGLYDSVFNPQVGILASQLSALFGNKSAKEYKEQIVKARLRGLRYLPLGNRVITHDELKKVKEFAIFKRGKYKGGFTTEKYDMRARPFGLLASRTIGRLNADKDRGMVGVENSYDDVLRCENGVGHWRRSTNEWILHEEQPARDGRSVVTTIDIDIQDVAEYSLLNQLRLQEADHGLVVLMEVKTGAIRAIANLHRQADGSYTEDYYNYAVGELAEPGSTFKLATLMACLEDEYVTLEDTIDTYNGEYQIYDRVMRDSRQGGHGIITVRRAFEVSSNIAFSRLVMKHYSNKKQQFLDRLHDLGLCDSLGLEIKGEGTTYLKTLDDPTWSGTTLPWMSIGYETLITPMQLLTFYNAVANNGTMMRPMFVECLMDDGKKTDMRKPHVIRNNIASSKTIRTVREVLKGVVENGTATNIKDTPYKIAGKTGTAQVAHDARGYLKDGERRYLASFAGYFPADDPLYSCVVMVYGPSNKVYYGNVVAGSVVKAIADRVYAAEFRKGSGKIAPKVPSSGLMPYSKGGKASDLVRCFADMHIPYSVVSSSSDWVSAKAKEKGVAVRPAFFADGVMPNVRGLGAADAVNLIESKGMMVFMSGVGRVVEQSPEPGTQVDRSTEVTLRLDY